MGLFQLRIFRTSIFQQLGFLFSSQKTSTMTLLASESGVLSKKELPLSVGLAANDEQRMSWANIQALKILMPNTETPVLPINERSLYPLDPYKKLSDEERRSQASLKVIADKSYIQAQANVSEGKSETQAYKMGKTVLWSMAIVAMLVLLGLFMRGVRPMMIYGIPAIYILIGVLIFAGAILIYWLIKRRKPVDKLPQEAENKQPSKGESTVNESLIPSKGKVRAYYWTKEHGLRIRWLKEPIGSLWTADTTMPEPGACYLVKTKDGGINDSDYKAYDPRHSPLVETELPQCAYDATHVRKLVDNVYSTPLDTWAKFNTLLLYTAAFLFFIVILAGLDKL